MDTGSRILIGSLAVLAMFALTATLVARLTGFSISSVPDSPVVDVRELGFRDLPNGVVEVFEWQSQETISMIPSGDGSFLRGVVRSLVRQRRGLDAGIASVFVLTRYADGRLVLSDPATNENIDLIAFGPANIAVFDKLMDTPLSSATNSLTTQENSW